MVDLYQFADYCNFTVIQQSLYISNTIAVPSEWQDVFSGFYYAANRTTGPVTKTLVPGFQTILLFPFGPPILFAPEEKEEQSINKCVVIGPIKKAFTYRLMPGSEMLIANFKWDAFYRFFGRSSKLYEAFIQEADKLVNDHCFSELLKELKNIPSNEEQGKKGTSVFFTLPE